MPLLIALAGQRIPSVIGEVIESLDVMPTLLDLWGVPRSSSSSGSGDVDAAGFDFDKYISAQGGGGGGGGGLFG